MPIQLQIIAIILAICFFILTIHLIKKDHAEVRQMTKWLALACVLVLGALFPKIATLLAKFLGITTLTSLVLYVLTAILLVYSLTTSITLIKNERQLKVLTQELSLLKKKVFDKEREI